MGFVGRLANLLVVLGMVILPLLAVFSLYFSDFVPSSRTVIAAKVAAVAVGMLYGTYVLRSGALRRVDLRAAATPVRVVLTRPPLRALVFSLLFGNFGWVACSTGLPCVINRVIGRDGSMVVIVDGWQSGGRHGSCHGPTFQGVPPFMLGERAICSNALKRGDFPIGMSLRLEGRSSVLGISPTRYVRLNAP